MTNPYKPRPDQKHTPERLKLAAAWQEGYEAARGAPRGCLANFRDGDAMPDHRGCPSDAECWKEDDGS